MRTLSILLVLSTSLLAQDKYKFAHYLYEKGFYSEARLELQLLDTRIKTSDSLTFYSGLCLVGLGKTDSAVSLWKKLDSLSPFFPYARLCGAIYKIENGGTDSWLSSSELFKKKWGQYSGKLDRYQRKTPFVGGLLSALVPGLGKVYAGKPRQFLSTLVPIAIMGLQAWEGYNYSGFKSARFWVFGSVATLFYIGNIYGSAIAVRVAKKEQYDLVQHQVFVDLRLALHDLYGKPWK